VGIISSILRRTAIPWLLRRDNRPSALRHWRFLQKSQYWSKQAIRDYQWERLVAILGHAYTTVPYYRRIFDERQITPESIKSFADLEQLPPLSRETIRDQSDQLSSTAYPRAQQHQFGTGGTTRRRLMMHRDWESTCVKMGAGWRFEQFMGRKPGDKMCYVWPVHIDYNPAESLKARLRNRFLTRELMFSAGSATEETLERFYREMMSFRPAYLKVFPSAFYRFAEFVEAHGYRPPPIAGIM